MNKHNQKPSSTILKDKIEKFITRGNNWAARKMAHALLKDPELQVSERQAALRVLKITSPDTVALLTGGICLFFIIVVAFLVAY